MRIHTDNLPVARVYFQGEGPFEPGWYVQHYRQAELQTTRLEISLAADRVDAVTEAAGYVGCAPDQIQVAGVPWPPRQLLM